MLNQNVSAQGGKISRKSRWTARGSRLRYPGILLALALVFSQSAPLVSGEDLRATAFMRQVSPATNDIYSLNYSQAEKRLVELKQKYPEHPSPPLDLASVIWLRELFRRHQLDLRVFLSPSSLTKKTDETMPDQQRQAFLGYIKDSQRISRDILSQDPKNLDARYFLGASYGVLASFSITVDHSLSEAFKYGKLAYKYEEEIIQEDPKYYDAYMIVGVYEYVAGSLPWYLKWVAAVAGFEGSKERGLKYLNLAATRGRYSSDDAQVVLMVLNVRDSKYESALKLASALYRQFPENYIFQINEAQILDKMGKSAAATKIYFDVLKKAQMGVANFVKLPLTLYRYELAERLFGLGRLADARSLFEGTLADSQASPQQKAFSHLRLGQILDVENRRTAAVKQYHHVLGMENFDNSRELARRYLDAPYRER